MIKPIADLSDEISIETAEKNNIFYKTASPLSRFVALVIDYAILYGTLILLFVTISRSSMKFGDFLDSLFDDSVSQGLFYMFIYILFFFIDWFYFLTLEYLGNGQTIGKMALSIAVIDQSGSTLKFSQLLIRNFMRIIDINLTFFLAAFIAMSRSKHNLRLGDLAAGTVVVHYTKKLVKPDFSIASPITNEQRKTIIKLTEEDLYIVRKFLNSKISGGKKKRETLAEKLAIHFKNKLNDKIDITKENAEEYLHSLYQGQLSE